MRAFTSVDVCDPAAIEIFLGAPTTEFDDDNDIIVNGDETILRFWEPVNRYSWIEVDIVTLETTEQTVSFYLLPNAQEPFDSAPTFVSNLALHPGSRSTLKFPYCGEIEALAVEADTNFRIKGIRVIQEPQGFVEVVDTTRIIADFPGGDGSAGTDNGDGTYSIVIGAGGSCSMSFTPDFSDLDDEDECFLLVEVETSVNFESSQTSFNNVSLYSSQHVQKYYFDSDTIYPASFLFHPRLSFGCSLTVTAKVGRFQKPTAAFGVFAAPDFTESVVSETSDPSSL